MGPDVYFGSLARQGREECFTAVLKALGKDLSQFREGSFVGIKMTVGDEGNTGHIKPGLVRILVDELKQRGVKPFVFDTNVIYTGRRQNSVDHLNLAYSKGFTPDVLGCPYIIADSVFGTDSHIINMKKMNFTNIREIRVPSLVKVLDDLIVLSHVTGHVMEGYAASVKNVAMGMASRAGKQVQHSSVRPSIDVSRCTLCGCCRETCPVSVISEASGRMFINARNCIGCGECISSCKFDAIKINWRADTNVFAERMAEYACGILSLIKRKVFMNFAFDITEECDCISGSDPSIVEDAGIFASSDVLAVDKACFDMLAKGRDIFSRGGRIKAHLHQFEYAEKIGLGSLACNLIKL
ncbi:MAG: DUF362 domain-containing protein [Nitrospirota bacterium]|nr:DUF362 domain-containing protein [Nitrospirota bacterium]